MDDHRAKWDSCLPLGFRLRLTGHKYKADHNGDCVTHLEYAGDIKLNK